MTGLGKGPLHGKGAYLSGLSRIDIRNTSKEAALQVSKGVAPNALEPKLGFDLIA
jgi:hypothetical protein